MMKNLRYNSKNNILPGIYAEPCRSKGRLGRVITILCLLMASVGAWAGGTTTYYSSATVQKATSTGEGTVYVRAASGGTGTNTTVTNQRDNNQAVQFDLYATAADGYQFSGWSSTADGNSIIDGSNTSPWTTSVTSSSTDRNNPTIGNFYAVFTEASHRETVGYVFYSGGNNGEYLANSTDGTTNFDPNTCIWTGTSGGLFTNGTSYLRTGNSGIISTNRNNATNETLGGTESGTTGQTIYGGNYYLRYNNGAWTRSNSGTASGRTVVFAVTKETGDEVITNPAIIGEATFNSLTSKTYSYNPASYTSGYNNYIFYNNTNHYFTADDSQALSGAPTSEAFDYVWSLSDEAEGHVTVNASTGQVSYNTLFANDTEVTLTLTATSRTTHKVLTAEKRITFIVPQLDPTEIIASDIDYIMVGEKRNINPSLVCATPGYPNIYTVWTGITSQNTGIATVDANAQVTGVAPGTTTITITAGRQAGADLQKVINVIVKANCVAPTVTFSNVDNTLTMSTTTPNAQIYYTLDGSDPTSSSSVYDPAHKPVLNTAETVKAITISNDAAHYIDSPITTLAVTKVATPTISINGEQVVIACTTPGAVLHYTTDGSDPTASSPTTSGTIDGLVIGTNVKVIAIKDGMISSNVASRVVKYNTPQPVLTFDGTEVTMTCPLGGAKIYYTTNGNNPTTGSTLYNPEAKPTITEPTTVKAIAVADGYDNSAATTLEIVRTATPGISVSGTTVTLSCADDDVTYYYTTDNSEPTTASASTTGTSLNDTQVPPGSTLKVAALGNAMLISEIASKVINFELTAPEIEITGGNVTITGPAGATIHYTTDGSEPTESSPTYTAPLPATNGMTYKAIATKVGYTPSDVATEKYMIASGANGTTVTINDYEDHTWTYYQPTGDLPTGYPTDYLHSPDPRNVKITYRGGSVNNASAVAISGLTGEGQNEMVYYKTLEKTVLGMTGNYPYQVISNPFSKRPRTNGSTGTNGYFGFAGWKIISGGKYIAEHADNDVLGLDEIIHFTNLDENYTPNCKSGEVIFEATWAAATVKTGTTAQTFTGGTYETNFWVITGNTGNISLGSPCTMSARYPDGTSAGNYSIGTGAGTTITTSVDNVKIEFLNLNTTGNISADGRNFTMGRGITWSRTAGRVSCGNRARSHTVKIESGKYGSLYHFTAGVSGAATDQLVILGNDYDRAKNDNAKLEITGQMIDANANTVTGVASQCYVRSVVKSGSFMTGVSVGTGAYTASYYFGGYGSDNRHVGRRFMTIEGGEFTGSVCGGTDASSHGATARAFDLRVRGNAVINGAVYGGAENAQCYGVRTMIFTGGTVKGWVCAAANGTSNSNGDLTGTTYLYMGGNARVDSEGSHTVINRSVGGNVFAAGCGYQANNATSGLVRNGTNLVVADNTYIERGAYGGGSYGFSANTQTTNIFITGGHVAGQNGGVNGTNWDASVQGGVYGGACQNAGGTINITMTGGLVEGGLYGGSNVTGTIAGKVTMQIDGGQVGTTTTAANVHGGGFGSPTRVNNDVEISLGKTGAARDADGVTVWGDVYGGSALGSVNGTAAADTYHTNVTMNAGYIHGSLYGGALGNAGTAANVYGPVQVKVYGGSVFNTDGTGANGSGAVYGANNINGAPQRSVTVDIYGTNSAPEEGEYALFSVYGGGNQANYTYGNGYPKVTVHNCDNSIEYVYGGGNAAAVAATDVTIYGGDKIGNVFGGGNGQVKAANVNGDTNVKIYGGTIGDVYGGSNTNGTIGGTISVNVDAKAEGGKAACPVDIDNVYGGGNKAASAAGNVTIGCAEHIGAVYGGANQANITGNINLSIVSGHIDNVFGGNNTSGNISGTITVTVNDNNSACGMEVGNVYGGGNKAAYGTGTNYPVVNIQNGHLTGSVFGGGLGETAVVTGNPQVTIGQPSAGTVHIDGNVFGGGDAANVVGKPVVLVQNCSTQIGTKDGEGNWNAVGGTVYGGGNAADVTGADNGTSVTINGGDINRVFGGGNGEVSPANVEGDAVTVIHAGNIHQAFAGSNMQGNISGSATITVDHSNEGCEELIDEVYGGGNQAAGNAGTVNIACGAIIGDVYGGANQADINSPITLNITGGTINRAFGGNNTSGNISGAITVNVNKADDCNDFSLTSVFGGGNLAEYAQAPTVNIIKGAVSNVYGGGNEAGVGGANVNMTGGQVLEGLYGGCNTSGSVSGDIAVNITNGTVGTDAEHTANVHGGGYGAATATEGNVTVTIAQAAEKTVNIWGDVYGGSALGNVNNEATDLTKVQLDKGTVHGNIYGGGLGAKNGVDGATADVAAVVNGEVQVVVNGGTVTEKIFGCNNLNGTPKADVTVTINGTDTPSTPGSYALSEVYGGGNMADYVPTKDGAACQVVVNGCDNSIGYVYGGGNAADVASTDVTINGGNIGTVFGGGHGDKDAEPQTEANVTGNVNVKIYGGTINQVFAGSNSKGTIGGTATLTVNKPNDGTCEMHITEVYGGGNQAAGNAGVINIGCTGGETEGITDVYGGAREANVTSDITLNITGGNINRVFGGNNISGNITGNIVVNINEDGANCGMNLNTVYGAGNQADYSGSPVVNIIKGTVKQDVFGGGLQATVGGNTQVNVTGGTVTRDTYGGGALANVNGNTEVNLTGGTVGSVYGGGLGAVKGQNGAAADVEALVVGNTLVTLNGSKVTGSIFGCNNLNGTPQGHVKVHVLQTIGDSKPHVEAVYGGGNLAAYIPSQATIDANQGFAEVLIENCSNSINYVYGGGNAAPVPATQVTIYGADKIVNAFAGGNGAGAGNPGADIGYLGFKSSGNQTEYGSGVASIAVYGGTVDNVYGGSNTLGYIRNGSQVVVEDAPDDYEGTLCTLNVGNVFGGGNRADMDGNVNLVVGCSEGAEVIYAGASNADVNGNITLTITSGTYGKVFGGNNDGGSVNGSITVNIDETSTCWPVMIGELYGCGNNAAYTTPNDTPEPVVNVIACTKIGKVFGGGYGATATVTGNPTVNVNMIKGSFAGKSPTPHYIINNAGERVANSVAYAIPDDYGQIGNIYGGGNAADVIGNTVVNISTVDENHHVSGADQSTDYAVGANILGNVFGGGNVAKVSGNTTVNIGHE